MVRKNGCISSCLFWIHPSLDPDSFKAALLLGQRGLFQPPHITSSLSGVKGRELRFWTDSAAPFACGCKRWAWSPDPVQATQLSPLPLQVTAALVIISEHACINQQNHSVQGRVYMDCMWESYRNPCWGFVVGSVAETFTVPCGREPSLPALQFM